MKRKLVKLILFFVGIIVVAIAGMLTYVKVGLPNIGEAKDLKIEYTHARIERGKYLANSVMLCMDCHSQRDYTKFAAPVKAGTFGKGGELFGKEMGFPGDFYSPNLTPHALGNWTDGELFRAITTGVSKDGRALFPVMPYHGFGTSDPEDIYSVIAYIRTLEPIPYDAPPSSPEFPMNFIINTIPREASFTPKPPREDLIAYGKYLVNAASCSDCHTKQKDGKPVENLYLAGGVEFKFPDGTVVRSMNITSDAETGIGKWSEEQFVKKFKMYGDSTFVPHDLKPGDFKTVMPWTFYGTMEEADLKAIFAYLQTVKPVQQPVTRFEKLPPLQQQAMNN